MGGGSRKTTRQDTFSSTFPLSTQSRCPMKCVRTQFRFFFILGRSRGPSVKGAYCRPPHGPMSACSPFGNLAGKEFALIISCETPRKGPQHWNGVASATDSQQCPGLRVLASGGNIAPYLSPRPSSSPAASPPPCSVVGLQGQRPRTLLSPNAIPRPGDRPCSPPLRRRPPPAPLYAPVTLPSAPSPASRSSRFTPCVQPRMRLVITGDAGKTQLSAK